MDLVELFNVLTLLAGHLKDICLVNNPAHGLVTGHNL